MSSSGLSEDRRELLPSLLGALEYHFHAFHVSTVRSVQMAVKEQDVAIRAWFIRALKFAA